MTSGKRELWIFGNFGYAATALDALLLGINHEKEPPK